MSTKLDDSTTNILSVSTKFTVADQKQISGLVHERNMFLATIKDAQQVCSNYILPDSKLTAEQAMLILVGILNDKKLVELTKD